MSGAVSARGGGIPAGDSIRDGLCRSRTRPATGRYGLTRNAAKTHYVDFRHPRGTGGSEPPASFDFRARSDLGGENLGNDLSLLPRAQAGLPSARST